MSSTKRLRRIKKHIKRKKRIMKKAQRTAINYIKFSKMNFGYIQNSREPIRFRFYDNDTEVKYEVPSEREIIKYRQCILHQMYYNKDMSRNAYYTLKAMNKKCFYPSVYNFIRNRRPYFIEAIERFSTTPRPIMHITMPVHFPTPVRICTVDISTKEEKDEQEKQVHETVLQQ